MKVLFLDVDGVLNSYESPGYMPINKNMFRRICKVIEETGCQIVLSSTWRKLDHSYHKISRKFSYKGIKILSKTTTEHLGIGTVRGHEIQHWLDNHPKVECYAIVDDDSDMLDHQMPYFVNTDGNVGLTDEKANELIKILGRKQ